MTMIVTKLYKGQGLGNQLWAYATLRSIAWRHGYQYGVESPHNFKLPKKMPLDMGCRVFAISHERPYGIRPLGIKRVIFEDLVMHKVSGIDITDWQSKIADIPDRSKIEGYFQSVNYVKEYRGKFMDLFKCNEDLFVDTRTCLISVRGGDYLGVEEICLDRSYFLNAIKEMQSRGIRDFQIVTDDNEYAKRLLPQFPIISTQLLKESKKNMQDVIENKIAKDFSLLQQARHLILSNSTFAWWAAWTNPNVQNVIAPKFWGYPRNEFNLWSPGNIVVNEWQYLDRTGSQILGTEVDLKENSNTLMSVELEFRTVKSVSDWFMRLKVLLYKACVQLLGRGNRTKS